jgi:hypothetical protein
MNYEKGKTVEAAEYLSLSKVFVLINTRASQPGSAIVELTPLPHQGAHGGSRIAHCSMEEIDTEKQGKTGGTMRSCCKAKSHKKIRLR